MFNRAESIGQNIKIKMHGVRDLSNFQNYKHSEDGVFLCVRHGVIGHYTHSPISRISDRGL